MQIITGRHDVMACPRVWRKFVPRYGCKEQAIIRSKGFISVHDRAWSSAAAAASSRKGSPEASASSSSSSSNGRGAVRASSSSAHRDSPADDWHSALYDSRNPLRSYESKQASSQKEFIKQIRKCHGLYTAVYDELLSDLTALGTASSLQDEVSRRKSMLAQSVASSASSSATLQAGGTNSNAELGISSSSRAALLDSFLANLVFPKHVHKYFAKAANGASLFPSVIYTHLAAGLAEYCMEKRGTKNVQDALRFVTYYRSPLMLEELYRLGYKNDTAHRLIAKAHFMQFHAGSRVPFPGMSGTEDPDIFSGMTRKFYPCDSHVSTGSTDLGRDLEMQTARAFCMGLEGKQPPVTVIASGDTGFYTDGAMHAVAHLVEARERGFPMPLIFVVNANNSSISSRLHPAATENEDDFGLAKLQERFASYESVIDKGFVSWAPDVQGGIATMQNAVDQVLRTGRPTYVICRFPFRPGGHANDQNPAPDAVVLDQFDKLKECLLSQLADISEPTATGADLAKALEAANVSIGNEIEAAICGTNVLTRAEAVELSQPGALTVFGAEQGKIHALSSEYLTSKNHAEFAGMGSDIFARTINQEMDKADKKNRACRYVHQENHKKDKNADSRGGVYGELNLIEDRHTDKFVNFLPHESQVMQVGAAMRSVLPENNLVFVKGPHTIFNEHARDHMKYAAYRYCDSGTHGNVIYMFDGGSIASFDVQEIENADGSKSTRAHWLARVGEHHNTPEYSSFASDANTVMALPLDMNAFRASMPEMVRLHDLGRMVICVVPTAAFQLLHGKFPLEAPETVIGLNDVLQVKFSFASTAEKPKSKRKLVVLAWGPEAKMAAKVVEEKQVNCDFFILSYNRTPNALVDYLRAELQNEQPIDVLVVDGNPNAGLLGPVVTDLKRKLPYSRNLVFSECTIPSVYIPYGVGDCLLQAEDVVTALERIGAITAGDVGDAKRKSSWRFGAGSGDCEVQTTSTTGSGTGTDLSSAAPASAKAEAAASTTSSANAASETIVVNAPLDGDNLYVTFVKKPGDQVEANELIAEIESDKATIEIKAPRAGTISEFCVAEQAEVTLASTDPLCKIKT